MKDVAPPHQTPYEKRSATARVVFHPLAKTSHRPLESTNLLDSLGESFLLHMVNIDICAAWQNNNFVYTNVNKAYNAYLCPQSHVIKQSKGRHVATHAHPSGTTLLNLLLGNDPLLQTSVMLIVMPLWNRIIRFTCCSIETSYGLTVSWQKTLKTTRQDCMKACEYLFSPWFGAAEWRMSVSQTTLTQNNKSPRDLTLFSYRHKKSHDHVCFFSFEFSDIVSECHCGKGCHCPCHCLQISDHSAHNTRRQTQERCS